MNEADFKDIFILVNGGGNAVCAYEHSQYAVDHMRDDTTLSVKQIRLFSKYIPYERAVKWPGSLYGGELGQGLPIGVRSNKIDALRAEDEQFLKIHSLEKMAESIQKEISKLKKV